MPGKTIDWLKEHSPLLSVGVISANIMRLEEDIRLLERNNIGVLHFDVMDGHFALPLTVGAAFIKAIKTVLLKDVHLMISNPLEKIPEYIAAGADMITLHVESCLHAHRALQQMRDMKNVNDEKRGIVRGIALNPGTPLSSIEEMLDEVEIVYLLAVNPGFPSQKFLEATKGKIKRLWRMIQETQKRILIGLDGGITRANFADIASTGADIIVTGSAVFDGKQPVENITYMQNVLKETKSHEE
ncbi:MAG: ribulose-phosphate 3-epimerase [Chitinivibrionales bacterium]